MCYGRIFEKKDTERPRVLSFFMFCVCVCRAAIVLYVYKGLVLIEDQTHRCHHRYIVIEKGITKILAEFAERERKKNSEYNSCLAKQALRYRYSNFFFISDRESPIAVASLSLFLSMVFIFFTIHCTRIDRNCNLDRDAFARIFFLHFWL